jgi:MraZ protein
MTGFLGEYPATLDAKGRFLLPAGFKKQLPEEELGRFVINRGFEMCLALYPVKNWEPLFNDISKLNDFDPKVRQFRRNFLNGATFVERFELGRYAFVGTPRGLPGGARAYPIVAPAASGGE